jgi:hypothetical protein
MQAVGWRKWSDLTFVKSVNEQPESIKRAKSSKEICRPESPHSGLWETQEEQARLQAAWARYREFKGWSASSACQTNRTGDWSRLRTPECQIELSGRCARRKGLRERNA